MDRDVYMTRASNLLMADPEVFGADLPAQYIFIGVAHCNLVCSIGSHHDFLENTEGVVSANGDLM